jgi:hypothetical protein
MYTALRRGDRHVVADPDGSAMRLEEGGKVATLPQLRDPKLQGSQRYPQIQAESWGENPEADTRQVQHSASTSPSPPTRPSRLQRSRR